MPISIQVRDGHGEIVYRGGSYVQAASSLMAHKFPLFAGIDEFGDTVFNRRQVDALLREGERLLLEQLSDDQRASLTEIAGVMALHMRRPHRYLWFVGD